jgi:hypothetical protein
MGLFIATLESRSFFFLSAEPSYQQAEDSLKKGLKDHALACGIPENWWHIYRDSIHINECAEGGCLRDNEPVLNASEAHKNGENTYVSDVDRAGQRLPAVNLSAASLPAAGLPTVNQFTEISHSGDFLDVMNIGLRASKT